MGTDLHFLTIAKAAELIQARKISPVELTQALLARVAELDPQINAFITVTAELALQQARQAEKEIAAGCYRGPLHGIPFGLKDLYYTAGILTSGHSRIGMSHIPGVDATTTAKLDQAGAILLGKLATHEFAHAGVVLRRGGHEADLRAGQPVQCDSQLVLAGSLRATYLDGRILRVAAPGARRLRRQGSGERGPRCSRSRTLTNRRPRGERSGRR